MLLSQHYLQDSAVRLRSLEKMIKGNSDLDQMKTKFYGIAIDMMFAAEENLFCMNDYSYKTMKDDLTRLTHRARDTEDGEELKAIIQQLLNEHCPEDRNYGRFGLSNFRPAVNQGATRYQCVEPHNLEKIANALDVSPARTVHILDPRCRDGFNLKELSDRIHGAETWGIEMETSTAERAKQRVDHIAMGSLTGSRISNEVFDIMVCELPISWMLTTTTTSFAKQEKMFLQNILKYVRHEGAIVLLLPYFRLYKDMCVMISKNLDNVQVRRLSGRDFYDKGLVAIVGTRSNRKEPDEDTYRMLRRLHNPEEIDDIFSKDFDKITLPKNTLTIETFRGSILDMDEMARIVDTSGCVKAFWDSQNVEKLSENVKQPLLPFNIGQIGLVLTSGCLDGIVDEGDGHYHVIKGRVSKKSTVERDLSTSNQIEVNETITNRVEINVMMPNGQYKVLA